MNNIKSVFSIKDLENLTGIKAHTIRIWEKRYQLLEPERTDTNIRYYSLESLQKLLNVSYLNNNGYKISKIANLEDESISNIVKEVSESLDSKNHIINAFKMAMLNFDQNLFYKTYKELENKKSFESIFYEAFMPLLNEIGLLWQTNTITPAHEHFITTLIRQKIIANTEKIQTENQKKTNTIFVLYLPDNEIHELGLLFLNYNIIAKGHQTIFLGQSIPLESLIDITKYYNQITFISYFTIKPEKENINEYLTTFNSKIITTQNNIELWLLGRLVQDINSKDLPKKITVFKTIENLVKNL